MRTLILFGFCFFYCDGLSIFLALTECPGMSLDTNLAFKTSTIFVFMRCLKECKDDERCYSFAYDRTQKTCYLFETVGDDTCTDMVVNPDVRYIHKEIKCKNGATPISSTRCSQCTNGYITWDCSRLMKDCLEGYDSGIYTSGNGVYDTQPDQETIPRKTYCTMSNGRTRIEFRDADLSRLNFQETWANYVSGFGDVRLEFWSGLNHAHYLTSQRSDEDLFIFFSMVKFANPSTLVFVGNNYSRVKIQNESLNFRLTFDQYSKTFPFTLGDFMAGLNGSQFSTVDRDNDGQPEICSTKHQAGFWFGPGCTKGSPHGPMCFTSLPNRCNKPDEWFFETGDLPNALVKALWIDIGRE